MATMATALDWNLLSPLVQTAARPIGQQAMRWEQRPATDEVRIYFGSGWYADVAWEIVHEVSDGGPLDRLADELVKQYERHGMPITKAPPPDIIGEIVARIHSLEERGAKSTQMVVFVGAKARRDIFKSVGKLYESVPGWAYHKPLGHDGWICQIENVAVYLDHDCPSWYVQWGIHHLATKAEHRCPGCGELCVPPVDMWNAKMYGCAKCCPSIGSYSGRIVIKIPTARVGKPAQLIDTFIDGLTEAECLQRYETNQRHELGGLVKSLTPRQLEVAHAMWSTALRVKAGESAAKDRNQVTIDTSMWDD